MDRIYDGFSYIVAQDADADPSILGPQVLSESVNRVFRGGKNKTRPPFVELTLVFANSDDEDIVTNGNFQGAIAYRAVKHGTSDGFVHAHAGHVFFTAVNGSIGKVTRISDAFSHDLMHVWFVQAVDRVYIQNGRDYPLMWDGYSYNQCTILNPENLEMPVGTFMAYAHGRVHLVTTDNFILSSDNIYSNGFTDTSATKNFSEVTYWADGGAFGAPLEMGNATGIAVLPSININNSGQGELVVFYEHGAMSLNISLDPRTLWSANQINRVSLVGRGCESPWSVVGVNGDVLYRSNDGWAFYSNSQAEVQQTFSYKKLSREVNPYVNEDTDWLKQFASAIFFDNRVIATVQPFLKYSDSYGSHRAHKAMVIADLEETTLSEPDAGVQFRWNGLWTGVRPCQLLTATIAGQDRAFAFSFDTDGKNRIYEITSGEGSDYSTVTGNSQIKSAQVTKRFNFNNVMARKTLNGGFLLLSEIKGPLTAQVYYRPDYFKCWQLLGDYTIACDPCSTEPCNLTDSFNIYKNIKLRTPDEICIDGYGRSTIAAEFQAKIVMQGQAKQDRFGISASSKLIQEPVSADCEDVNICTAETCCLDDWYNFYNIV